jgi:hypothetical protein
MTIFNIGDVVEIIAIPGFNLNKVGDIGVVTNIVEQHSIITFQVTVEGRANVANWHQAKYLKITVPSTKTEDIVQW